MTQQVMHVDLEPMIVIIFAHVPEAILVLSFENSSTVNCLTLMLTLLPLKSFVCATWLPTWLLCVCLCQYPLVDVVLTVTLSQAYCHTRTV